MAGQEELLLQQVLDFARREVTPRYDPINDPDPTLNPVGFVRQVRTYALEELVQSLTIPGVGPLLSGNLALAAFRAASENNQQLEGSLIAVVATGALEAWPAGSNTARNADLIERIFREVAKHHPDIVATLIQAVREARQQRSQQADPLLRPAPTFGSDPLVEALSAYARGGGVRIFIGFLGMSDLGGYRRLYTSLELTNYLDIPSNAIVYTVNLRTPENPLGGSAVWVRVGTDVIRGQTAMSKMEVQPSFLRGRIAGQFGGRMSPRGMTGFASIGCTSPEDCFSPVGCTSPEDCFSPAGCTSPEDCRM